MRTWRARRPLRSRPMPHSGGVLRGAGMARTIPGMVAFDTLKASRRLRDAGFEEKQANALVNAFAEDIGANLATKDDLVLLRKDMAGEFAAVRQDIAALRQAIEALGDRMTSENAALRNEMAIREERLEERMNARIDRQSTRFTLIVAGLAGLILTAIGIATGVLAAL